MTFLCVLALAAPVCADTVRVEIGLGGVFPAGGWTTCRISGLDNVTDGGLVIVRVSEMFERHLGAKGGTAEGLILMPDESPMITVDVQGGGRVALPPEAARHLRGVKDRLPAVFVGDNVPDEADVLKALDVDAVFPIRMTPGELSSRPLRDFEWVRVFVIGKMSGDELTGLRGHFSHLSDSVLVARPGDVAGWLDKLPFEEAGGLSVCNRDLAEFLPVPRGSVRPEFYEIFGPPRWPRSARRDVAWAFGMVLAFAAFLAVLPEKRTWVKALRLAVVSLVILALTWGVGWLVHAPGESIRMLERTARRAKGFATSITSTAALRHRSRWTPFEVVLARVGGRVTQAAPVAFYPEQWVQHPLVVGRQDFFMGETPVPSREVWVRFSVDWTPKASEDFILTDGSTVWTRGVVASDLLSAETCQGLTQPSQGRPVAEYEAERRHADRRIEALRDGMFRCWRTERSRTGLYHIGWTRAGEYGTDAGTMVVTKMKGPGPVSSQP